VLCLKGRMTTTSAALIAFLTLAAPAAPSQSAPQEKPAPNLAGTWLFEVHHSAGVSTPTVTITQTAEKLAGRYVGSYGESDLVGTIKGAEFTFTVEIGTEQKITVVYKGTLTADAVKGTVSLGEMGEGTFTGKRKQELMVSRKLRARHVLSLSEGRVGVFLLNASESC